jgi:glc operon protein GlcG
MSVAQRMLRSAATVAVVLVLAWFGASSTQAPKPTPSPPSKLAPRAITLTEARVIIDSAIAYARPRNMFMAVIVVDAVGNPVSCDRMDGASANNVL